VKGLDAFELASNYLTDRELKAIRGLFESIIDIIDQWGDEAKNEEKFKKMLEHLKLLSDPEKKELINTFLLNLSQLSPAPSSTDRDKSANKINIYAKGCRPPRPCWELDVKELMAVFRNR
jgi:hypothetical protein